MQQTRTYIMGILNVTPDSFSDGGTWQPLWIRLSDACRSYDQQTVLTFMDVGGESTSPGHTPCSLPRKKHCPCRPRSSKHFVKSRFDIPVSVDTYKGNVAEAALQAGADLVNDVWGFKFDSKRCRNDIAKVSCQPAV